MATHWRSEHKRRTGKKLTTVRGCYVTTTNGTGQTRKLGKTRAKSWSTNCPVCDATIRFTKFSKGGAAYFDEIPNLWVKHSCLYQGTNLKGTTDEYNLNLFEDYRPPQSSV